MADNIHTYTVQCSLPINLFNEKIFLIIWFWLYFTTLFTLFGFIYWIISFFYPNFYKTKLLRYLSSMKRINIHHFPQDPFQEPISHHRHSHHHHRGHRSHSFSRHSHYGQMHAAHHYQHQHHLMPPYGGRVVKSSFDSARSLRAREQATLPTSTDPLSVDSNGPSTPEEQVSTPTMSRRITTTASESTSVSIEDNQLVNNFLVDYLGRDGALVLYILKINTNDVITGETVTALFELYKSTSSTDRTE